MTQVYHIINGISNVTMLSNVAWPDTSFLLHYIQQFNLNFDNVRKFLHREKPKNLKIPGNKSYSRVLEQRMVLLSETPKTPNSDSEQTIANGVYHSKQFEDRSLSEYLIQMETRIAKYLVSDHDLVISNKSHNSNLYINLRS